MHIEAAHAPLTKPCIKLGRIILLLSIFLILLTPSTTSWVYLGTLLCYCHPAWRRQLAYAWQFKQLRWLSLLLIMLLIGMLYSVAPWHDRLKIGWKYADKLLIFFFCMPLFTDAVFRRRALNTFIAGIFVTGVVFALWHTHHLPQGLQHLLIHTHPPIQAYASMLAVSIYILLDRLFIQKTYRAWYTLLLIAALADMFFINQERIGMLTVAVLIAFFLLQHAGRWRLPAILIVLLLVVSTYAVSPVVHERVQQARNDILQYQHNQVDAHSSLGIRLQQAEHAFALIKQRPVFGWGTAAFQTLLATHFPQDDVLFGHPDSPENGLLNIAVQLGLVGLLVVFLWFFYQWRDACHGLAAPEVSYVTAFVIAFGLMVATTAQFYAHFELLTHTLMLCVLFGAKTRHASQHTKPGSHASRATK